MLLGDRGPIVSFCFDDFPRTAYTTGGTILKSFGVHGTYYVALGLINTTNTLGDQFTQADLNSLLEDGHELGCHTFNHSSCRNVSASSFEMDVRKGREAIRQHIGSDASDFAYPYGHVSMRSKGIIGAQMNSCRGTYGGINERVADLNLLRANSLYGDVEGCARVEALLAENVRSSGWLIFYTHDVRKNHSPFGCTPVFLDRAISLTVESGNHIVPVKAAIDIFGNALPE
ncbi:polysaccharide deacetylase family protein [Granulicella sp. dw_53]|uniref:polysaccharide deacetylase family protein n=1 Tax=Granulicella sp. dw_53 TaxID=2719792 RepID=UPI001BD48ACE|nr:polysaccharide deacetylase family protein [Granulicella sp. dw_53]